MPSWKHPVRERVVGLKSFIFINVSPPSKVTATWYLKAAAHIKPTSFI